MLLGLRNISEAALRATFAVRVEIVSVEKLLQLATIAVSSWEDEDHKTTTTEAGG